MAITPDDLRFLRRTLLLARRARGHTSPNPMVGAMVVQDGRVVGEGFHPRAGAPHAEVYALLAAGEAAAGGTLYVSLEPCAHYGRTPPCTDRVIAAGLRRVVFAALDLDPRVAGAGLAQLQQAGLTVEYGALADDEARLNEAYRHWQRTRTPFVTLKMAASLDGRIATCAGESRWISGAAARRDVHRLRDASDAILTTSRTVAADNPSLTARLPGARDPRRVVVDAHARTPATARVYDPAATPPLLATLVDDPARLAPYRARGVEVLVLPATEGHVDLPALLRTLGEREILSLLVEAGGTFAAALLHARAVQKVRWYLAPRLIGGREAVPAVGDPGFPHLADLPHLHDVSCRRVGEDFRFEGYLTAAPSAGDRTP